MNRMWNSVMLAIVLTLVTGPAAALAHGGCGIDPTDVNYGYYAGYGYGGYGDAYGPHAGYHWDYHNAPAGHYGVHSGLHYSPEEGWHYGTHAGFHQGAHYGDHSGVHVGNYTPTYVIDQGLYGGYDRPARYIYYYGY